ncbi:hypothetical protein LCGC14_0762390 [marine sediment metagenome]|uniref:Uncharacterized protein n=1 Tax=marine sediment metagenome TaxID=412755 RepID=A0A0F9Q4V7_9ZZZZ
MSQGNLDWTNRVEEDALHVDEQMHFLMKSFGLQLMLEALMHRTDVSIQHAKERNENDDYLHKIKANLEKTLEDYKNRYAGVA